MKGIFLAIKQLDKLLLAARVANICYHHESFFSNLDLSVHGQLNYLLHYWMRKQKLYTVLLVSSYVR